MIHVNLKFKHYQIFLDTSESAIARQLLKVFVIDLQNDMNRYNGEVPSQT